MLTRSLASCAISPGRHTYAEMMSFRSKSTLNARLALIDRGLQKVSWSVKDKDDVPRRPWDLCITCSRSAGCTVSHHTIALIPESSCIVRSRLG